MAGFLATHRDLGRLCMYMRINACRYHAVDLTEDKQFQLGLRILCMDIVSVLCTLVDTAACVPDRRNRPARKNKTGLCPHA